MDQNDLFAMALGLSRPWKVVRSGFEEAGKESKFLYVDLEVEAGAQMPEVQRNLGPESLI